MKIREILDQLDYHHQMAAAWKAADAYLQRTMDSAPDAIPVERGIRSTLVTAEITRKIQNEMQDRVEIHEQMIKKYEEAAGDTKTLPKEPIPAVLVAPEEKAKPKAKKKAKPKGKPAEEPPKEETSEGEPPKEEPPVQEVANG